MATQHEQAKGKSNGRGPTLQRRNNLRPLFPIYWNEADAEKLRLAVDCVTRAGAAIMLGRTSDGGALSVCILDGDTKIKEYPHTADEVADVVQAIIDEYAGLGV